MLGRKPNPRQQPFGRQRIHKLPPPRVPRLVRQQLRRALRTGGGYSPHRLINRQPLIAQQTHLLHPFRRPVPPQFIGSLNTIREHVQQPIRMDCHRQPNQRQLPFPAILGIDGHGKPRLRG